MLTKSQTVKKSGGGGGFLTKRTRWPYTKTADRHGGGSIRLRRLSAWLQAHRWGISRGDAEVGWGGRSVASERPVLIKYVSTMKASLGGTTFQRQKNTSQDLRPEKTIISHHLPSTMSQ